MSAIDAGLSRSRCRGEGVETCTVRHPVAHARGVHITHIVRVALRHDELKVLSKQRVELDDLADCRHQLRREHLCTAIPHPRQDCPHPRRDCPPTRNSPQSLLMDLRRSIMLAALSTVWIGAPTLTWSSFSSIRFGSKCFTLTRCDSHMGSPNGAHSRYSGYSGYSGTSSAWSGGLACRIYAETDRGLPTGQ